MLLKIWKNSSPDVRKALGNANWLLFGRIISMFVGLATTIILARRLGAENFGQLNYLLAWGGLMVPFFTMGLPGIVTRQFHDEPEATEHILGTALLIRATGAVFGALILIIAYIFTASEENFWLLPLLFFAQSFSAAKAATSWFESRVQIAPVTITDLLVLVIASMTKIILVLGGYGWQTILLVFIAELAIVGLIPLVLFFFYFGLTIPKIDFKRGRAMLKNGLWLVLASVAVVIYVKVDQIMLGIMRDKSDVGFYAAAIKLSDVWQFLPAMLVSSFFPWLLKGRQISQEVYYGRLQKLSSYLFLAALIIAITMSLLAYPLIEIIYGPNYISAASILIVHVWCLILVFNLSLANRWLLMEEHYRLTALFHAIGAAVNIVANYILIPPLGGTGAAIATLVALAFPGYILLFMREETRPMWRVINRSYVLSSIVGNRQFKF